MEIATVLFENPINGQRVRINACDVVANPHIAHGLVIVAQQGPGAAVVLDDRFASSADYIKPADEKPVETPVEASSDEPKAETSKKRGRPAKGV